MPKGLLAIVLIRQEDFSDLELDRIRMMSLKEPENHIMLFIQTQKRLGKIIFGSNISKKFVTIKDSEQLEKVNMLIGDAQFLAGADYLVKLVRTKL